VFCKISGFQDFILILNYFSIAKPVDRDHGPMDQIHGLGPPWPTVFIEYRSLAKRSAAEIRSYQIGMVSSIRATDQATDGRAASSLGRRRWRG
jgi:hypothetical protein